MLRRLDRLCEKEVPRWSQSSNGDLGRVFWRYECFCNVLWSIAVYDNGLETFWTPNIDSGTPDGSYHKSRELWSSCGTLFWIMFLKQIMDTMRALLQEMISELYSSSRMKFGLIGTPNLVLSHLVLSVLRNSRTDAKDVCTASTVYTGLLGSRAEVIH